MSIQTSADTGPALYRVWPRRAWFQTIAGCLVAVVLIVTVSSVRHPNFTCGAGLRGRSSFWLSPP